MQILSPRQLQGCFIVAEKCLSLWIYDDWEKFNDSLFSPQNDFHSHLNMEDITRYAEYTHKKRVCKDFEIKIVG